jgi:DNA (cytosine-5)-methyltransferase 1
MSPDRLRGATACSGICAPEVAMPWVKWLWRAEIEDFPAAVGDVRHGNPNLGDITAPDFIDRARAFGPLDLLVAGTPCQSFSLAGKRESLADDRGNLTLRMVEIVDAIQPRVFLWENVPGVLSTRDNAFGCFLAALVGADSPLEPVPYSNRSRWWKSSRRPQRWRLVGGRWEVVRWRERFWPVWPDAGVVAGPSRMVAWRKLDAQYFGVAQRRERVFVVAGTGEICSPEILFEREGLQRYFAPSREAWTAVTALTSNGVGTCGADDNQAQGGASRAS